MESESDDSADIVGPDGYRYQAVRKKKNRDEPFVGIELGVRHTKQSLEWYTKVLKMKNFGSDRVGYADAQVYLRLVQLPDNQAPNITQWEGRNAISMPAELLLSVYKALEQQNNGSQIVHPIQV